MDEIEIGGTWFLLSRKIFCFQKNFSNGVECLEDLRGVGILAFIEKSILRRGNFGWHYFLHCDRNIARINLQG
jgi:hypothetical protein